jgi:hypothetical protein
MLDRFIGTSHTLDAGCRTCVATRHGFECCFCCRDYVYGILVRVWLLKAGRGRGPGLAFTTASRVVRKRLVAKRDKRRCDLQRWRAVKNVRGLIGPIPSEWQTFDYEPKSHAISLGTRCVTPRNCQLPSDLIENASLSSSPRAQSQSSTRT